MRKLVLGTILLALVFAAPISAKAGVNISVGIALPPAVIFSGPIELIVLPDTYIYDVYVVPDIGVDIFFCRGWWWRPWDGRWYRSRYHDRGWTYYRYIPDFYYDIDARWRGFYKDRNWHGHRWDYRRIPFQQLEKNWRTWNSSRYWERGKKWNVEKYRPISQQKKMELRRQREREYTRRPEVQRHEQWKREHQKRQPQVHQPRQQQPQRLPQTQRPGQLEQQRQPQVQKQRQPQQRIQPQVQGPGQTQRQRLPQAQQPKQRERQRLPQTQRNLKQAK